MTDLLSVHTFNQEQTPATAEQIEQQLQQQEGPVYVFYSHPSVYVAAKLSQQQSAGPDSIQTWLGGIETALTAQRNNRRRIRLVCLQDALANDSSHELAAYQPKGLSGLYLMAGNQLVQQNEEVQAILQRLEAITQPMGEHPYSPVVDVEHALQQHEETQAELLKADETSSQQAQYQQRNEELESENELLMQQLSEANKRLDEALNQPEESGELKEENELLLLQLQQVQEELESTFLAKNQIESECNKLKKQVSDTSEKDKLKKQLDENKSARKALKEENELLLLQLQQVQEELEAYFIKSQDAEKRYQAAEKQRKHEHKAMNQQPQAAKQLKTENDKLLAQLLATQEQLEAALTDTSTTLQQQKLERQLARQTQQVKQLESKQQSLQTTLRKKESELAQLQAELADYQAKELAVSLKEGLLTEKKPSTKSEPEEQRSQPELAAQTATKTVSHAAVAPAKRSLTNKVKSRLKLGKRKGADKQQWLKEQAETIKQSHYFDSQWYLQQYPDLKEAGVDPAGHFLRFGGLENRNPSKHFNTEFYLTKYPDVAAEGINPLLHFIMYGEAEGRLPKPKKGSKANH